ncbi:hypothetical protein OsI_00417 [Oryza sativa Indica Group]|uniref:Uncharacterized protein n=1 Tax=Oryza sativa subsp. indica TaxID=39946 RepID=B8ADB2_ORYSI|nr:hypothetical protein OsI_00417 [Oryza sativa Indica Group]
MVGVGSVVPRLYLSVYNWVVFFGWAQVLYYLTFALLLKSGHEAIYATVEQPLQFAQTDRQTAAFMEEQDDLAFCLGKIGKQIKQGEKQPEKQPRKCKSMDPCPALRKLAAFLPDVDEFDKNARLDRSMTSPRAARSPPAGAAASPTSPPSRRSTAAADQAATAVAE